MRVTDHLDKTAFTQWLLNVGHGWSINSTQPASSVLLPPEMCCYTEKDLITSIYGSLSLSTTPSAPTLPLLPADETDLYIVLGTNRLSLSAQKPLIRVVMQDAIENLCASLLFEHAFPTAPTAIRVVWECLLAAAEQYRPGAAAIHK